MYELMSVEEEVVKSAYIILVLETLIAFPGISRALKYFPFLVVEFDGISFYPWSSFYEWRRLHKIWTLFIPSPNLHICRSEMRLIILKTWKTCSRSSSSVRLNTSSLNGGAWWILEWDESITIVIVFCVETAVIDRKVEYAQDSVMERFHALYCSTMSGNMTAIWRRGWTSEEL